MVRLGDKLAPADVTMEHNLEDSLISKAHSVICKVRTIAGL